MKKVFLAITGMHCTACAMNIDGELEDTKGVKEAKTNYAKQVTEVTFDPQVTSSEKLIDVIKNIDSIYNAEVKQEV